MTLIKLRCFPRTLKCPLTITLMGHSPQNIFFPNTSFWILVLLWTIFLMNWISPSFNICNFSCFRSQLFRNVSVLKNYIRFTKKHRCWSLFLIKWQTSYFQPAAFIKKETPARVFSCKFCEISKNIFL